jgi:CRISPR-associated protein Cst2
MNNDKVSQENNISIKDEDKSIKSTKILTLTYLIKASFTSLNGSDKEADNMSNIKKITMEKEQFPYASPQALRRGIRNQLGVLGEKLSEGVETTIAKGAASTQRRPEEYIDDDLFGYMGTEEASENAKGRSIIRASIIRITPLVALSKYEGDLDFGTNFMSVKTGGNPNIFETEIHSGIYRGTILIELDRVGRGDGFKKELDNKEKARRVKVLLVAIKNLWMPGRQTRFLTDISPKFMIAAMLKTKNPIFLESVLVEDNVINSDILEETIKDFKNEIVSCVIGMRRGIFTIETKDNDTKDNDTKDNDTKDNDTKDNEAKKNETIEQGMNSTGYVLQNIRTIGDAFEEMTRWTDDYYT